VKYSVTNGWSKLYVEMLQCRGVGSLVGTVGFSLGLRSYSHIQGADAVCSGDRWVPPWDISEPAPASDQLCLPSVNSLKHSSRIVPISGDLLCNIYLLTWVEKSNKKEGFVKHSPNYQERNTNEVCSASSLPKPSFPCEGHRSHSQEEGSVCVLQGLWSYGEGWMHVW